MKKLAILIMSLFSFALFTNAKESWEFKEFKFSEDVGLTNIIYQRQKGGFTGFVAIGNEYGCASGEGTCNVYRVDETGKVTKANKYYDNTNSDFPGYHHYKLEMGNDGKLTTRLLYNTFEPSKESPMERVVEHGIFESTTFNYLKCIEYENEIVDMCIVGYEKDSVQYYGIISSDGEYEGEEGYIVEPKSSYALVFDSNDSPNFAALQDENNYYIVSGNGNVEKITKSFLSDKNIDIKTVELEDYSDDANYYSSGLQFFTKNNFSSFTKPEISIPEFIYGMGLINDKPFISVDDIRTNGFSLTDLYSWDNKKEYDDIYCYTTNYGVLSYNKDNKLYVTDLTNNLIEVNNESNVCKYLITGDKVGGIYLFTEIYNATNNPDDSWKPKYYLLSKTTNEDPKEEPSKPGNDTPKYTCKKVDGKFYDKNGKEVTKNEFENSCPEAVPDTGYIAPVMVIALLGTGFIIIKNKRRVLNRI